MISTSTLTKISVVAVVLCSASDVQANPSQAAVTSLTHKQRLQRNPNRSDECKFQLLNRCPADLPNFPHYTGKTSLVHAALHGAAKGGPVYTFVYSVREDSNTVLTWYAEALKSFNWTSDSSGKGPYIAARDRQGNSCRIATTSPSTKEARCNVIIQYKLRQGQAI